MVAGTAHVAGVTARVMFTLTLQFLHNKEDSRASANTCPDFISKRNSEPNSRAHFKPGDAGPDQAALTLRRAKYAQNLVINTTDEECDQPVTS